MEIIALGILFRCASISWFQVVSRSVSDILTASASTGLSELFCSFGNVAKGSLFCANCQLILLQPDRFQMQSILQLEKIAKSHKERQQSTILKILSDFVPHLSRQNFPLQEDNLVIYHIPD